MKSGWRYYFNRTRERYALDAIGWLAAIELTESQGGDVTRMWDLFESCIEGIHEMNHQLSQFKD